jgi:hypothetical protein
MSRSEGRKNVDSIQKARWEEAMAIFHWDPIHTYEEAIEKHKRAIRRLRALIKKLKSNKK